MDQLCNLAIDVPIEKRMSENDLRVKFSSGKNVFRLEGYFDWLKGTDGKLALRDAAEELTKLKDRLADLVGTLRGSGHDKWFTLDQECGRMAGDQLGDMLTGPDHSLSISFLRNRYHAKFEKRYPTVACRMSHIARRMSHVACRMPHVACFSGATQSSSRA